MNALLARREPPPPAPEVPLEPGPLSEIFPAEGGNEKLFAEAVEASVTRLVRVPVAAVAEPAADGVQPDPKPAKARRVGSRAGG